MPSGARPTVIPWLLACALLTLACETGPDRPGRAASPSPTRASPDLVFPVQKVASGYESRLDGILVLKGRCVPVRIPKSGRHVLPFWPPDTTYEHRSGTVVVLQEGREVARVGEPISLGGGEVVRPENLRDQAGGYPEPY
jgi:hypothetical protein